MQHLFNWTSAGPCSGCCVSWLQAMVKTRIDKAPMQIRLMTTVLLIRCTPIMSDASKAHPVPLISSGEVQKTQPLFCRFPQTINVFLTAFLPSHESREIAHPSGSRSIRDGRETWRARWAKPIYKFSLPQFIQAMFYLIRLSRSSTGGSSQSETAK